jgi:hypothetical protein
MQLGFFDASELRARHAALAQRRVEDREIFARRLNAAHRAVNVSWQTLARSHAMVEQADRSSREREINELADDLLAQQCEMMAMHDDGTMLAAIFPHRNLR